MAMILDKFEAELFDRFGLTSADLEKFSNEKFLQGSQWTTEEINKLNEKYNEMKKHSEKYVAAYRDGFIDGTDLKQNYKCSFFGLDIGVALDVLSAHVRKNAEKELSTKITEAGKFGIREETVIKVIDSINIAGYKIVLK